MKAILAPAAIPKGLHWEDEQFNRGALNLNGILFLLLSAFARGSGVLKMFSNKKSEWPIGQERYSIHLQYLKTTRL